MSNTLNEIIDNIAYKGNYLTHSQIISWAKHFNEYEKVIKMMDQLNVGTINNEVQEVRTRQFYQSPIYGGTGQTVTMEAPSILRSRNEALIIRIHDLTSTKFSRIVEEYYSNAIAAKRSNNSGF